MTNTRLAIRRGSGGKGKWISGDGTLRIIRVLEPTRCAILRRGGTTEELPGAAAAKLEPGESILVSTRHRRRCRRSLRISERRRVKL